MMPALSSTLSALGAFEKKLGITAENIANVATEGYKKKRALSEEGPNGTVEIQPQGIETAGTPPGRSENLRSSERQDSNVALEEEIPELVVSVYGFKANLKTLKAQDEILGSLLDTVA